MAISYLKEVVEEVFFLMFFLTEASCVIGCIRRVFAVEEFFLRIVKGDKKGTEQ